MISFASVAATTWSTETPGASSLTTRPSSVGSITASSVTMRLMRRAEVNGSVHFFRIFGLPLAVWIIAMTTRLQPVTRSMAPPMPGTILPGTIQLASRPRSSTSRPPSTVRSTWPPRIRPNEKALSKAQAPGTELTQGAARVAEKVVLQARVRQRRQADQPVLQLEEHVDAGRKVMGDHGGQPNAEIDEVAVLQFERDAARDEFLSVH